MKPVSTTPMPERNPLRTAIIVFAIVEVIGLTFFVFYSLTR